MSFAELIDRHWIVATGLALVALWVVFGVAVTVRGRKQHVTIKFENGTEFEFPSGDRGRPS